MSEEKIGSDVEVKIWVEGVTVTFKHERRKTHEDAPRAASSVFGSLPNFPDPPDYIPISEDNNLEERERLNLPDVTSKKDCRLSPLQLV